MTSRQIRNQRREAERKARKLAYRQSRAAAASAPEICAAGSAAQATSGRFSAAVSDVPQTSAAPDSKADPLVREPVPRPALASSERTGPTGPRSSEGKAISSGNSLKHGLASGRIIIPGEDPAAFEALLSDLIHEHAPASETESLLVQQMAQSWWLMQRAIRLQNEAFTETGIDTHKLALFLRYQTTHERAFYRALNSLIKLQNARRKSDVEFVSQSSVGAMHASAVSQPRPQISGEIGFVSQNAVDPIPKLGSFRKTSQG